MKIAQHLADKLSFLTPNYVDAQFADLVLPTFGDERCNFVHFDLFTIQYHLFK